MTDYNNLDLDVIKGKIGEFASIAEAKSFILKEEVSFNPLKIKKNTLETAEFLDLLNKNESFSFDGIYNINSLLEKADKLYNKNWFAIILYFLSFLIKQNSMKLLYRKGKELILLES